MVLVFVVTYFYFEMELITKSRRGSRDGADPGMVHPPTQWACLEKSSLLKARKHPRRMELINILDSDG